ncbi:hypothetical protein COBT_001363 [Conglomerata obtusa]
MGVVKNDEFYINNKSYYFDAYVVKNFEAKCIIGCDFLDTFKAKLSYNNNTDFFELKKNENMLEPHKNETSYEKPIKSKMYRQGVRIDAIIEKNIA